MGRGIENVSGVSCHISCALQVLYYTLDPLREALSDCERQNGILAELSQLFRELGSNDDSLSVDPSSLYRVLGRETSLDSNDVGDASSALSKILQVIRKQGSEWPALLDKCVGVTAQSIIGSRRQDGIVARRIKRGKKKVMPCPFPLTGDISSVETAIHSIFEPVEVTSYNWDKLNEATYEEEKISADDASITSDGWKTTKSLHLENVPNFWFLHLERFSYDGDVKTLSNAEVTIPFSITMKDRELDLRGGVVHVCEDSIEEEGHYVSIVRDFSFNWILLDDDRCKPLDEERAMELLQGSVDKENGKFFCATLLAYASNESNQEISALVDSLKIELAVDASDDPHALVGRRVSVKWAKGKYYAGVVESFDCGTGKHRIKYDDGDVKEYVLAKKTLEWL